MRGCQGIPLPKKPARRLRGSRPAARCSAAHQACGWGGAGPFLSQRRGSSPRPRGPSRSARPRGWPAAWRGPGPDAHVPAAGALPASRAQPSEPPPWLLRTPPSACSDGAGRDQHRWAPPRARPWANCVLSGLFPGLRGDGGAFPGRAGDKPDPALPCTRGAFPDGKPGWGRAAVASPVEERTARLVGGRPLFAWL